jgi:hypothetical protein
MWYNTSAEVHDKTEWGAIFISANHSQPNSTWILSKDRPFCRGIAPTVVDLSNLQQTERAFFVMPINQQLRKETSKARYERNKANGICTSCGRNPAREGRNLCADCVEKSKKWHKTPRALANKRASERYRRLRLKGMCASCAKVPSDSNHIYCPHCLEIARESDRRHKKLRKEEITQRRVERDRNSPGKYLWYGARRRAKEKGLDFNIDIEDIIIPTCCPYLGHPLKLVQSGQARFDSATLDRIDSSKGYIKGNIQVISRRANMMKNDASAEELIVFALKILADAKIKVKR